MNTESSKGSSKVCDRENSEGSSNGNNTESAACVSRPSTVIRGFFLKKGETSYLEPPANNSVRSADIFGV